MFLKGLGISVYVGRNPIEKDMEYITLAAKYGFTRIFTCFLSVSEENKQKFLSDFKGIVAHAKSHNMAVVTDVNPTIMKFLGVTHDDLSLFHELGVYGIRLDEGFSGAEEALMSYNPYNIKIEFNSSTGTLYLNNIMSYRPNLSNIIACHNFYPRRYTGLSVDYFMETSKQMYDLNIHNAAFVSSNAEGTFSTQEVVEGLPTIEEHRSLDIVAQAKELFASRYINDVIIGNAYASEEELAALGGMNKDIIVIDVEVGSNTTATERSILEDNLHMFRGDNSGLMIRSTMMRIYYKDSPIAPHDTNPIEFGDVTIDNDNYGRYKGEMHIATAPMDNNGGVNIVGRVTASNQRLLKYVLPWSKFRVNIVN